MYYIFVRIKRVFKVIIWWMTNCNLLKLSFVWKVENFFRKKKWFVKKLTKAAEAFTFLSLRNNSVTIGWRFLLQSISTLIFLNTINTMVFLFRLYSTKFILISSHPYQSKKHSTKALESLEFSKRTLVKWEYVFYFAWIFCI